MGEEKASLCESLNAKCLVLLHSAAERNGKLKRDNMILKSVAKSLREHQANDYPQLKQMHNAHGLLQGQSLGEPHQQTQQQHQQRHCGHRWQTHQQHQKPNFSREALPSPSMPCTLNRQAMIRQLQLLQMAPELHAYSDLQTVPSDSTATFSMASTGGSESVAASDDSEWEACD